MNRKTFIKYLNKTEVGTIAAALGINSIYLRYLRLHQMIRQVLMYYGKGDIDYQKI